MYAFIVVFATALLALGPIRAGAQCSQCAGDINGDDKVTIDEILVVVNNALTNCPAPGPRFVDNGDGTVSDTKTGLMWEKKSGDNDTGVHGQGNTYTWSTGSPAGPNGEVFTSFLATLNNQCFAGHCDWRLPTVTELQSLVNFATPYPPAPPATDPAFNTGCTPDCTVLTVPTCSCTRADGDVYWTSTAFQDRTVPGQNVWAVDFIHGLINPYAQEEPHYARAVRSAP